MATTNIELDIENITGVADADNQFIISSQKLVSSTIPKELLKWASNDTSTSDGGDTSPTTITLPTGSRVDNVISVRRNDFEAEEVSIEDRGFIANTSSLKLATSTFPKYYKASANRIIVKPDPTDSEVAIVEYIDFSKIDDDSDLRNAVVNFAVSKEFSKLASDNLPSWSSILPPITPSLTEQSVSFSTSAPTYVKPTLSLTTFPTLSWVLPSRPVSPVINANTSTTGGAVVSFSETAPTYVPPVMQAPNWSDVENWINTEEDSEMLAARVQAIQSQISDYQVRLNESQSNFNKENIKQK